MDLNFAYAAAGAAPLTAKRESYVATRGQVCNGLSVSGVQAQSASYHVMMDDVDSINIRFANWWVNATGQEVGPGAAATIECFIEYPIFSTPQRVQFDGQNVGNIPDGGEIVVTLSDGDFKRGVPFRILTYRTCTAGLVYHGGGSAFHLGEKMQIGASVTNTIATAAIGGSDYVNYYAPLEITGMTKLRTWGVAGDSIPDGYLDLSSDFHGNRGFLQKALGDRYAFANMAVTGDRAVWFAANYTKRKAILDKASDIWLMFGRNDLGSGGRTGAQVNTDMTTIANLFAADKKLYTCTLAPWSASTDNWMTDGANQTFVAGDANNVNTVNTERLKRNAPFDYCADVFTILSSRGGPFTPKWKVDASQAIPKFYTTDGTHPNERAHNDVARSGLIRLV